MQKQGRIQGVEQGVMPPPIVDWVDFFGKNWLCLDVGPALTRTGSVLLALPSSVLRATIKKVSSGVGLPPFHFPNPGRGLPSPPSPLSSLPLEVGPQWGLRQSPSQNRF